jgi:hypothetical protein
MDNTREDGWGEQAVRQERDTRSDIRGLSCRLFAFEGRADGVFFLRFSKVLVWEKVTMKE